MSNFSEEKHGSVREGNCVQPDLDDKVQHKCCFCFDSSYNRFVALILIIVVAFLYSANFNMPGSMANVIERTFLVVAYEYEYMYSVYSLPNIVMCFFGGLAIDRLFGLLHGSVIFGMIALLGQVIITVGGFDQLYWLMLVGRFINGIGAETVSLCLSCYAVLWFKDKELNLVFGLFMSVTGLGSSFAFLIFTPLYQHVQTIFSQHLTFGMSISPFMGMSVVMVTSLIILGYFSSRNQKSVYKSQNWESSIELQQILKFPLIYWIVLIMLSISNNAVFGFISISQLFLHKKYDMTAEDANFMSSAFNLFSALVSPFPGLLVDRVGKDLYFNMVAIGLGIISQIIMCLTTWNVWIPLIIYAVYFSMLNSCGWPLVARIVKPYQVATAYGVLQSSINLVATGYNILVGFAMQNYGPTGAAFVFLAALLIGIICCITVWLLDRHSGGTLNYTAAQRKALL